MVDVIDAVAPDLSEFIPSQTMDSSPVVHKPAGVLVCENVTLSLDYQLHWNENGIIRVILMRTVGTINIDNSGMSLESLVFVPSSYFLQSYTPLSFLGTVVLSTRYSATFLNGQVTAEPNSGNPGKIRLFFFTDWFLTFLVGDTDILNDRISSRKACHCWILS